MRKHRDTLKHANKPGWILVGQWLDQSRIHKSEDCHAGAHSESQRQDCGAGESQILSHLADREGEILQQVFEEWDSVAFAVSLLRQFHTSQLQHRVPSRLL